MDVGSVLEVWDDVETEVESSSSSDNEDLAQQEFHSDLSAGEPEICDADPGPSSLPSPGLFSSAGNSCRRQHIEYNWQEISTSNNHINLL